MEQKDGLCLKEKINIRQESGWLQTDGEEGSNETVHATVNRQTSAHWVLNR